jgi:hypothetical protein
MTNKQKTVEIGDEDTLWIHVFRTDKEGKPLSMLNAEVSRVPSVGEHITWTDEGAGADESKDRVYRVTHVLHVPRDEGSPHVLAEVRTVEDESWVHGTPKLQA